MIEHFSVMHFIDNSFSSPRWFGVRQSRFHIHVSSALSNTLEMKPKSNDPGVPQPLEIDDYLSRLMITARQEIQMRIMKVEKQCTYLLFPR